MCEQCFTQSLIWKKPVVPGFFLTLAQKDGWYMKKGWFGLLRCNDPDFVFKALPEKDPAWGREEDDSLDASWYEWYLKAHEFGLELMTLIGISAPDDDINTSLTDCYELGVACKEAGWNPEKHPRMHEWLFHTIACHIETEKDVEDVGFTNGEKETPSNPRDLLGA